MSLNALIVFLLPLFVAFEFWQLVVAERYLGIEKIRANADPRRLPMSRAMAAVWTCGIFAGWLWYMCLFLVPHARGAAACMLGVSLLGLFLRRVLSLKWILVCLTFEGAIRFGMMVYLGWASWRHWMR